MNLLLVQIVYPCAFCLPLIAFSYMFLILHRLALIDFFPPENTRNRPIVHNSIANRDPESQLYIQVIIYICVYVLLFPVRSLFIMS